MIRLLSILTVLGFIGWLSLDRIEALVIYPFDGTDVAPTDVGLPGVTARAFDTGGDTGGETLVVWTAPPKPGKPVVFYLHGNAGNLANRAGRFRHFLARGYGLVAMAYRGSSGSSGTPTQAGITADVRALWAALHHFIPNGAPVVIYGESLGTGVATVALINSAVTKSRPPAALILESPYTSIFDVGRALYPTLAPYFPDLSSPWNSLAAAPAITLPLLVLHGTQDEMIPQAQGRAIFDAALSTDKQFLAVQGAGHTTLWRSDTLPALWRFIDRF